MSQTAMMPLARPAAEGTVQRPRTGFSVLIEDLVAGISGNETLEVIVRRLLTIGERQSFAFGLRSLTRRQSTLLQLRGDAMVQPQPPAFRQSGFALWYIGICDYGRILLTDSFPNDGNCTTVAYLCVPDQIVDQLETRPDSVDGRLQSEVDEFFCRIDDQQRRDILDCVWHGIDHIDPVLIYVNESTFTNFDAYNNLTGKTGSLLTRFDDAEVELLPDEKRFVFCFYWLLQAGLRGEEFNGVQLTPRSLYAHLNSCLQLYSHVLDRALSNSPDSIAGKAQHLCRLRQEAGRDFFTYRYVNGLNFNKEEQLAARALLTQSTCDLPRDLHQYVEDTYNLRVAAFSDLGELFRACVENATYLDRGPSDLPISSLELFLRKIVVSALDALHSDIGMTRGIRNLRRWQVAVDEKRYGDICGWPLSDYFCGVFPSREVRRRFQGDRAQLSKILIACSVRMQFNSWHYMPGHFPKESVPEGRHYYYPPRMADTTIWSDQHHAGHVKAGVRFAIRSPAALEYRKRLYPGMVDLRLYRATGAGYTRDELFKAIKYTEYLRSVYQAIADISAATGREIVIESFDKQWFERYGANDFDTREMCANESPVF